MRKSFMEMKYWPQKRYSFAIVQSPALMGLLVIYSNTVINCLALLTRMLLNRSYHTCPLTLAILLYRIAKTDNIHCIILDNDSFFAGLIKKCI